METYDYFLQFDAIGDQTQSPLTNYILPRNCSPPLINWVGISDEYLKLLNSRRETVELRIFVMHARQTIEQIGI